MNSSLQQFTTSDTPSAQLSALRELAQSKTLPSAAKTEAFTQGVRMLGSGLSHADPFERLHALAALGRVWSSVKQQRPHVTDLLASASIAEPAPVQRLPDPDERAYAAHAARFLTASWVPRFASSAAVNEESGEDARKASIGTLLVSTSDLALALMQLRERLGALSFQTERPADSMGRRIRRIFSALHEEMGTQRLPAEGAGSALGGLIHDSFRRLGPPPTAAIRRELVATVADVVHDIVRVRFAQATQPSTYDALEVLSRWFQPHEWEDLVADLAQVHAIAGDLLEAITLLAKAGITDQRMREALRVASGSEQRVSERLRVLADTVPGLNADVRDWLCGTVPAATLDLLEESGSRRIDQVIAAVLVRQEALQQMRQDSTTPRALVDAVYEIAKIRGLELAYSPGDRMDYSSLDHDLVGGARVGIRRVRVVEPQVRARESSGRFRVVRKALVEPLPD